LKKNQKALTVLFTQVFLAFSKKSKKKQISSRIIYNLHSKPLQPTNKKPLSETLNFKSLRDAVDSPMPKNEKYCRNALELCTKILAVTVTFLSYDRK
jgi:hypothetical protein